ncbi:MAG: hypothetical protein KA449_00975 [Pelolinea sp.]|nr:hypothetical protein [Pelolinea sp.]
MPNEVFQAKRKSYCDQVQDKLSYLRNPCGYSSLPYWKEITFQKPNKVLIFNEDEWLKLPENLKENFKKADKYFRIMHPLEQIDAPHLTKEY